MSSGLRQCGLAIGVGILLIALFTPWLEQHYRAWFFVGGLALIILVEWSMLRLKQVSRQALDLLESESGSHEFVQYFAPSRSRRGYGNLYFFDRAVHRHIHSELGLHRLIGKKQVWVFQRSEDPDLILLWTENGAVILYTNSESPGLPAKDEFLVLKEALEAKSDLD